MELIAWLPRFVLIIGLFLMLFGKWSLGKVMKSWVISLIIVFALKIIFKI